MFDLGYTELLLVAIVALIVVGPKDLPKLMRTAGNMVAKVRGTARHFKAGMDEMVRQAELDEMREKWDAHNQAIMNSANAPAGPAKGGADAAHSSGARSSASPGAAAPAPGEPHEDPPAPPAAPAPPSASPSADASPAPTGDASRSRTPD